MSAAGVDLGGHDAPTRPGPRSRRGSPISRPGRSIDPVRRRARRRSRSPTSAACAGHRRDGRRGDARSAAAGRGSTRRSPASASSSSPRRVPLRLGYDHDRAAAAVARLRRPDGAQRRSTPSVDRGRRPASSVTGSVDGQPDRRGGRRSPRVDAAMRDPATRAGAVVEAPVATVAPTLTTARRATEARLAAQSRGRDARRSRPAARSGGSRRPGIRPWIGFGWVERRVSARSSIGRRSRPRSRRSPRRSRGRSVDAEFLRDKRGRIVGSKADRAGRKLDVTATPNAIAAALEARVDGRDAPDPVKLASRRSCPEADDRGGGEDRAADGHGRQLDDLLPGRRPQRLRARTSPSRPGGSTAPSSQPGAVFDFWAGLGEVSFRTGYRLGGAIVGGHSVEGKALAGGICAASTTLFNAALRGGFEILDPPAALVLHHPLSARASTRPSRARRRCASGTTRRTRS